MSMPQVRKQRLLLVFLMGLPIIFAGCATSEKKANKPPEGAETPIVIQTVGENYIVENLPHDTSTKPQKGNLVLVNPPNPAPKKTAKHAGRPRVHSIGDSSPVEVFDSATELSIPIRGQDLFDVASSFSVDVQASVALTPGVDYWLDTTNSGATSSLIFLRFSTNATIRFNSADRLSVNININEKPLGNDSTLRNLYDADSMNSSYLLSDFTPQDLQNMQDNNVDNSLAQKMGYKAGVAQWSSDKAAVMVDRLKTETNGDALATNFIAEYNRGAILSSANDESGTDDEVEHSPQGKLIATISRTFILFTSADYRNEVLAGQIQIQNIKAYPLSYKEAKRMFGGFVADNFYALRLTLHNPTDQDQYVSLGAITAYGSAFVTTSNSGPYFTIPISMIPQSEQQMYTMTQVGKTADGDSVRDWVFGALDLAGTLATAYGTAFSADQDYIKAVALATGTAIPALGKLWEDKRPFHLLNINNFAMPDVIKIPKGGGSLDEKYLFFSKGSLQGVLQDPYIKDDLQVESDANNPKALAEQFSAPPISLAFDSLQIPYEKSFEASTAVTSNTPPTAPNIITGPASQFIDFSRPASLNVVVAGTAPFAYQWHFGTNILSGETSPNLTITNFQPNNVGTYYVVVTNQFGSQPSSIATINSNSPPIITSQPTVSIESGSATFTLAESGDKPMTNYLFYASGFTNSVANTTNTSISLPNITTDQAGNYFIIVSNRSVFCATSAVVKLSVPQ